MPLKSLIPAAGFGTRMLPAAKAVPKELLPVLSKPVIQYVVEEAAAASSTDILLVTSRDKRAIEDHFDRSPELESALTRTNKLHLLGNLPALRESLHLHSIRQPQMLGLGHAVHLARHHIGNSPFLCLLGDTIFSGPTLPATQLLAAWHALGQNCSVIGLERIPREKSSSYGIIAGEEVSPGTFRIHSLVEKPAPDLAPSNLAIAARYLLLPQVFDLLQDTAPSTPGGEIQLTSALNQLAQSTPMYGVVLNSRRHDIGSPEGWLATNLRLAKQDPKLLALIQQILSE